MRVSDTAVGSTSSAVASAPPLLLLSWWIYVYNVLIKFAGDWNSTGNSNMLFDWKYLFIFSNSDFLSRILLLICFFILSLNTLSKWVSPKILLICVVKSKCNLYNWSIFGGKLSGKFNKVFSTRPNHSAYFITESGIKNLEE